MKRRHAVSLLVLALICAASVLPAQVSQKPITHDVYDSWKMIRNERISPDGTWVLYIEAPQDGDARLVAVNPATDKEYSHIIGYTGEGYESASKAKPEFTFDSKKIVFLISPVQKAVEESKEKKDKEKLYKSLGIMDLADGSVTVVDSVKSFAVPEKNGLWAAFLKEKQEKKKDGKDKEKIEEKKEEEKKEPETSEKPEKTEEQKKAEEKRKKREDERKAGTMLVVRNLSSLEETALPHVTWYAFTKDGSSLFYTTLTKDSLESDGVYCFRTADKTSDTLLEGKGDYKKCVLNKDQTMFAFVTNRDDYESDAPCFSLYGCRVTAEKADLWVSHETTGNFPEGLSVCSTESVTFSDDGNVVMFGIADMPVPDEDEDDDKAKFDLWHWQDPFPQPQQKIMAKRVKENGWEAVYHIKKKKFVQLGGKDLPELSLNRQGRIAFANNNWPYAKKMSYFGSFNDVFIVDTQTGKRTLVKKELFGRAQLSSKGRYVVWFDSRDWFAYTIKTGRTVNLTRGLDVRFDREDHDTPVPPYPYGIAGYTDDAVLIYDRYDIWKITPDGKSRSMITEGFGREHNLSLRYVRLDRDEYIVPSDKDMLLRAVDQNTMATGFYTDRAGGSAEPQKLLLADKSFGRPRKAEEAGRVIFTCQTFKEYPDLWTAGMDFSDAQKITDLGAQTQPFIWGTEELIDFSSADGKPLKGILIKPDNFDPGKKYPLMVYIYETLHDYMYHRFRHPSPGSSINPSYYVSNGYVLWMPDIEYDTGYPGQDALKCVLPGIQMLVRNGYIDEDAIGIQGHSWGGYQIAYMITQTNIFAAVEAGAPVSNMTSAYGGIRWGSGMVRQFQYEKTQSRLGASLWEVPLRYIENSPLFWADKVETPIMMMHNDDDGAVPWYQGIEYMMALRRLGKEAYMFNYNGEKHGLRKRVNQEDWTVRLAEFFDHHLKGKEAPAWMKNGIKAWEK